MQPDHRAQLDQMLDHYDLAAVIRAMADVAGDKAMRATDSVVAGAWERTASYLDKVADTKTVRCSPCPART
jgi:hypothetical protein